MSPTRAALEAALAADPDDPARHAAYADLLLEEGDPRGEFIRLQLALEDPELPADRRAAMGRAADEMLLRHESEWLGRLGWYTRDQQRPEQPQAVVGWRRGWVDRLAIRGDPWTLVNALKRCPAAKLVRAITISDDGYRPPHETENIFRALANTSVRCLSLVVPRLHDDEVDSLIRSGLIAVLSDLDLSRCDITDDGALALAACPAVRRLKSLTLDGNLISPIGVEALAAVGVRAGPQFWDAGRGDAYV